MKSLLILLLTSTLLASCQTRCCYSPVGKLQTWQGQSVLENTPEFAVELTGKLYEGHPLVKLLEGGSRKQVKDSSYNEMVFEDLDTGKFYLLYYMEDIGLYNALAVEAKTKNI